LVLSVAVAIEVENVGTIHASEIRMLPVGQSGEYASFVAMLFLVGRRLIRGPECGPGEVSTGDGTRVHGVIARRPRRRRTRRLRHTSGAAATLALLHQRSSSSVCSCHSQLFDRFGSWNGCCHRASDSVTVTNPAAKRASYFRRVPGGAGAAKCAVRRRPGRNYGRPALVSLCVGLGHAARLRGAITVTAAPHGPEPLWNRITLQSRARYSRTTVPSEPSPSSIWPVRLAGG
jgi:hypothetical protein